MKKFKTDIKHSVNKYFKSKTWLLLCIAAWLILLTVFTVSTRPAAAAEIDINEANFETLLELDGISEVTAAKIIKYRRENKGFKTVYDLLKVDGITGELFEKIKDEISAGPVSNEPAAAPPVKTSPRPPVMPPRNQPMRPASADRIDDEDEDGGAVQPVPGQPASADEAEGEDEDGGAASPLRSDSSNAAADERSSEAARDSDYSFEEGRKASAAKRKAAVSSSGRSKIARIGDIKKIELTPDNYYKVIIGLMRLAKYDKAESNISDFMRKFPSDKKIDDMNYLMGACLEESEKYGEALEAYQKVYDNQNSELRAIALFRIGVCYDLMGKPSDALDNYRKYAASYPSSSCVKEAENRIDEMLKTK